MDMDDLESPSNEPSLSPRQRLPRREFLLMAAFWSVTILALLLCFDPQQTRYEYAIIGFVFGSIFGHATGVSMWASLSQHSLLLRGIVALFYLSGLWLAFVAMLLRQGEFNFEFVSSFGVCFGLQALLISTFGLIARLSIGLRLVPLDELAVSPAKFQFSITHVLILTLAIAGLMAGGRSIVGVFGDVDWSYRDLNVFLFLAMAAILVTLPLALACLLPRMFWLGLMVASAGSGVVVAVEHSTFESLISFGRPDFYHMLSINLFSLLFVFIFAMILRFAGFRLTIGKK